MKTKNIIRMIKQYFIKNNNEELNFHQILYYLNKKYKHGTTTKALINILGNNKKIFQKCGCEEIIYISNNNKYNISTWKLKNLNE